MRTLATSLFASFEAVAPLPWIDSETELTVSEHSIRRSRAASGATDPCSGQRRYEKAQATHLMVCMVTRGGEVSKGLQTIGKVEAGGDDERV